MAAVKAYQKLVKAVGFLVETLGDLAVEFKVLLADLVRVGRTDMLCGVKLLIRRDVQQIDF